MRQAYELSGVSTCPSRCLLFVMVQIRRCIYCACDVVLADVLLALLTALVGCAQRDISSFTGSVLDGPHPCSMQVCAYSGTCLIWDEPTCVQEQIVTFSEKQHRRINLQKVDFV